MSLRLLIALIAVAGLVGCGDFRITPSTGTGAANLSVNDGFGIGPTSEGPYGSVLGYNTLGRNGR